MFKSTDSKTREQLRQRPTMHLWQDDLATNSDGSVTYSGVIELGTAFRKKLWYKIPGQHAQSVTDSCDPLLIGSIFVAADHKADLRVHGRVSESLLRNLTDFQNVWHTWWPERFALTELSADSEVDDEPAQSDLALCAYSGGVDSSFSIYRQQMTPLGKEKRDVGSALLIQGFDISLDQTEMFAQLEAQSRSLLAGAGLDLITIATNFREINTDWIYTHGAALASSLMLFKRKFNQGIIASSNHYQYLRFPWGSNQITDPLLSSNSFEILHDASQWRRTEKIAALTNWPAAYDKLRVCFSGTAEGANCGECLKCIFTWLCARAAKRLPPQSIPAPTADKISALRSLAREELFGMAEFAETLSKSDVPRPLAEAFKRCISDNWQRLSSDEKPSGPGVLYLEKESDLFSEHKSPQTRASTNRPTMHLWPEAPLSDDDGSVTYSSVIELGSEFRRKLWYKVPQQFAPLVTESCDPLLLGILFLAADHKANVQVHGQVSPSLLRRLIEFQIAWQSWWPHRFMRTEILADSEIEDEMPVHRGSALCAFSGGVDSSYTIYRHLIADSGKEKKTINSALLVQGFDIPLNQDEQFASVASQAKSLLDSAGIDLITLKTNFREVNTDWGYTHGAALASALMLFKRKYTKGIISSTYPYNQLIVPWGSNPITDPLLSSSSFQIVHDAAHFSRAGKVQELAKWPDAYDRLRICFSNSRSDQNCGECFKCIATWFYARAANCRPPASLPEPSPEKIRSLNGLSERELHGLEQFIESLQGSEIPEPIMSAFKICINQNRAAHSLGAPASCRANDQIEIVPPQEECVPILSYSQNVEVDPERAPVKQQDLIQRLSAKITATLDTLIKPESTCALVDFPNYANVGDSAIWLGEKEFLRRRQIKLLYSCDRPAYSREHMLQRIDKDTIILLHGGGNFGDLWPWHQYFRETVIKDFPNNPIIVMPQSVYFQDKESIARAKKTFDAHGGVTILVRDQKSLALVSEAFNAPAVLCPDMVFLLGDMPRAAAAKADINLLLRTDTEAKFAFPANAESKNAIRSDWLDETALFLTVNKHLTGQWGPTRELWRKYYLPKALTYDLYAKMRLTRGCKTLCQGKVVVTDRLHGYILSLLMGVPHVVLDNSYGKIRSLYDTWEAACELTHWAESPEQAMEIARKIASGLN